MRLVRYARWIAGIAITQGLLLILLAWILPGFQLEGIGAALLAALVITGTLAVTWPIVYWLSSRTYPVLFPFLSFILTGGMILIAVAIINELITDGVQVSGIWGAIGIAIGLTIGNTLLAALFSLDEETAYDRYVTRPLRRKYRNTPQTDVPGILFLEIDGLSIPILEQALEQDDMPHLKRWLEEGSHLLAGWEPDLSAQTSASQAGILLGSNEGIPAFRWYDKERGKLMVSSNRQAARELEEQLSTGDGLLIDGGGSRWNVFSGDAVDCLGTFSKVGDPDAGGPVSYYAYFSSPYMLARTIGLFFAEVIRENWQAQMQRIKNVEPRIHRGFKFSLVRGGTNVILQEASAFMLASDMCRGMPSVYNTFFGYDEVAHHAGIDRPDSFKELRKLDQIIGRLDRLREHAPRPYYLIVLSDHGQSQGATFLQRYGKTLGDLTEELIGEHQHVAEILPEDEGYGNLSAAMTEAIRNDSRTARLAQLTLRRRVQHDEVNLGPESPETAAEQTKHIEESRAVVLASGNLGLISFPDVPERMTYGEITERYPALIPGLTSHEGISFVVVRTQDEGDIAIGKDGVFYLNHGYAAGENPLAAFGPNAARHLERESSFSNAPDILVMSMYDPETGEVAAFEELVGCHGGLGGPQTHPFVMYPAELPYDPHQPIIGAGALHQLMKGWLAQVQPVDEPAVAD